MNPSFTCQPSPLLVPFWLVRCCILSQKWRTSTNAFHPLWEPERKCSPFFREQAVLVRFSSKTPKSTGSLYVTLAIHMNKLKFEICPVYPILNSQAYKNKDLHECFSMEGCPELNGGFAVSKWEATLLRTELGGGHLAGNSGAWAESISTTGKSTSATMDDWTLSHSLQHHTEFSWTSVTNQ